MQQVTATAAGPDNCIRTIGKSPFIDKMIAPASSPVTSRVSGIGPSDSQSRALKYGCLAAVSAVRRGLDSPPIGMPQVK